MASVGVPPVHPETRRLLQAEVAPHESALGLIVAPDRRVLVLTNRRYGGWGLPGGKCEAGESLKSTCARELREELGVTIFSQQLSLLLQGLSPTDSGRLVTVFHVRAVHGQCFPREGGDMAWFTDEYLFRSRPFGDFYAMHFPDGFDHLMPTAVYG